MLSMIKGRTVLLYVKTDTGERDPFGAPIYTETATPVDNVLISPVSDTDMVEQLNLTGKKSVYTLHIPRGDDHEWRDSVVEFYGEKWKTFGNVTMWQDDLVPAFSDWASSISVERYE